MGWTTSKGNEAVRDETLFRYAHAEIQTQVLVICGPMHYQLDQGGAETKKAYYGPFILYAADETVLQLCGLVVAHDRVFLGIWDPCLNVDICCRVCIYIRSQYSKGKW